TIARWHLVALRVHALEIRGIVPALQVVGGITRGVGSGCAAEQQPRARTDRRAVSGVAGNGADDRARGGTEHGSRGGVRGRPVLSFLARDRSKLVLRVFT